jgi:hypothetical protein
MDLNLLLLRRPLVRLPGGLSAKQHLTLKQFEITAILNFSGGGNGGLRDSVLRGEYPLGDLRHQTLNDLDAPRRVQLGHDSIPRLESSALHRLQSAQWRFKPQKDTTGADVLYLSCSHLVTIAP